MLIKASEDDRQLLLNYCKDEPSINLFIIGDIEKYGFDSDIQDVWYQMEDEIRGIYLRYHDNLIVYSKSSLDHKIIDDLLNSYKINIISGKASILQAFYEKSKERFTKKTMNFCELRNKENLVEFNVTLAKISDAYDIALKYGQFDEFKHLYSHDVNKREEQIASRMSSLEGKHMFIKKEGIIAHGNTAAENQYAGMIGGVFTDKKYRRMGYAKQIVSALASHLLDQNKYACLFYSSEASEKLFKSLGFIDIDKWMILGGK